MGRAANIPPRENERIYSTTQLEARVFKKQEEEEKKNEKTNKKK